MDSMDPINHVSALWSPTEKWRLSEWRLSEKTEKIEKTVSHRSRGVVDCASTL